MCLRPIALAALLALSGATFAQSPIPQPSAILAQAESERADFEWGTLYTYFSGESYGTQDALVAVAVIKPGWEIHPPHEHAEEECLMVTEGTGTWSLNGEARPARAGDMLYAAPWDVHGITNTGETPLTFVVWKWSSKGGAPPPPPE